MKHMKRRLIPLVLAVFTLLSLFCTAAAAKAAPKLTASKGTSYLTDLNKRAGENVPLSGLSAAAQITQLKSSKKTVATVKTEKTSEGISVVYIPKKPGKTTISFSVKDGGKTKKFKYKLTVKKYTTPCKSFMLGSKNYASVFKKNNFSSIPAMEDSVKISVQAKKGWTLDKIAVVGKKNDPRIVQNNSQINMSETLAVFAYFKKASGEKLYVAVLAE